MAEPQDNTKSSSTVNLPRAYADVNNDFEVDIDTVDLHPVKTADWKVYQRIGRGKYSEVFEGKNQKTNEVACVKILKPCLPKLLKLEIYVLQLLKEGPNIIQLLHTLKDKQSNLWCLVFEILKCKELKDTLKTLNENDLRYYMYQTLKALDYAHSKGIIHRDVKPQNILIATDNRQLRLIDWGLAAFYKKNHKYSVRVATRAYKAPELLVEHELYHYAIDIWAFGCMFGGIIFGVNYFFHGKDFPEQLEKIIQVLGTNDFNAFLAKYDITPPDFVSEIKEYEKKPFKEFAKLDDERKYRFINDDSIDLLSKLLKYDPCERLTAKEAMQHTYFNNVRALDEQNKNEKENDNEKETANEEKTD